MVLLNLLTVKKNLTLLSGKRTIEIVQEASEINPRPIYKTEKPVRDPKYLALVRRLPCIVCFSHRGVEAAHFGPRGIGQRASDLDALPLCYRCHRTGTMSYHNLGAHEFIFVHRLDVKAHQERIQKFYREKLAA